MRDIPAPTTTARGGRGSAACVPFHVSTAASAERITAPATIFIKGRPDQKASFDAQGRWGLEPGSRLCDVEVPARLNATSGIGIDQGTKT